MVILYLGFALATFISAIVGLASGTGFGVSLVKTACQFDSTRISANIILGRVLDPAKAVNRDMDKILKDVDDETARALAARDGRLTEDAQKVLIASLEIPLKKLGQPQPDSYLDVLSNNFAPQHLHLLLLPPRAPRWLPYAEAQTSCEDGAAAGGGQTRPRFAGQSGQLAVRQKDPDHIESDQTES